MENNEMALNILDLSDYVLMEVFKYVTSTDLWQLTRTCSRFSSLVVTKKLWKRVDLRDAPFTEEKIAFGLRMINKLTEDVRLCSTGRHLEVAPLVELRDHLSSINLTVLVLENQKLCGKTIKVMNFPKTLVELSLRKTYITFPRLFLDRGNEQMINLKVLILDRCFWVETVMLVQLSKYRSLEILSMYDCKHIDDADIAYISLAGRFGFYALRIFDCRFTPLGDQTLRSLYSKPALQEIYFQNYPSSYFLEKGKRNLDIAFGSPVRNHSYLTDLDDIPMFDKETVKLYFGETDCQLKSNVGALSDEGTLVFRFGESVKDPTGSNEYKSVLYERPYGRCTCFKNSPFSQRSKGSACKMKSLKGRELAKTERLIERELRYAGSDSTRRNLYVLLPNNENQPEYDLSIEATLDNHYMGWVRRREPRNNYEVTTLEYSDIKPPNIQCSVMFLLTGNDEPQFSVDRPEPTSSGRKRKREGSGEEADRKKGLNCYVTVTMGGGVVPATKHKVGLKRLSLRGYGRVTDQTLLSLAKLNLKLLDITFTGVTEAGVKEFTVMNPECRVVHESLCKCRPRMHF